MSSLSLKKLFVSTTAAVAITASSVAQAGEDLRAVFTDSYGKQNTVDCGTIFRFPDEQKKLRMSCEFVQQVDSNKQDICGLGIKSSSASDETKDVPTHF